MNFGGITQLLTMNPAISKLQKDREERWMNISSFIMLSVQLVLNIMPHYLLHGPFLVWVLSVLVNKVIQLLRNIHTEETQQCLRYNCSFFSIDKASILNQ